MPRVPNSYVAEWFGHIVWPPEEVDSSAEAIRDQTAQRCPFLSNATGEDALCIKKAELDGIEFRTGFCTQSSPSTGVRRDWLACPARVFDEPFTLIRESIRHLYQLGADADFEAFPISRFGDPAVQRHVGKKRVFAFASNPPHLGGEIDIPETERSPGNKADVSIFEITSFGTNVRPQLGKWAIFEIQTADFHGSPLHAIREIREMGPSTGDAAYHQRFAQNPERLGVRLEGPNKANVFKRTIYQMILKIQMALDPDCVGFCVVLPEPVWESWERHLGGPLLVADQRDSRVLRLAFGGENSSVVHPEPAWILVFEIDRKSPGSPKPLRITKRIATDSKALLHYAFERAPEEAIKLGATKSFAATFARRLSAYWNP